MPLKSPQDQSQLISRCVYFLLISSFRCFCLVTFVTPPAHKLAVDYLRALGQLLQGRLLTLMWH